MEKSKVTIQKINYKGGNLKYEGEIIDNKFSGKGKLYYNEGNLKYEGDFKNNRFDGEGSLYLPKGVLVSKGKFKGGIAKDVINLPNGDTYKGDLSDSFELDGYGVLKSNKHNFYYSGQFKKNVIEGYGTSFYDNNLEKISYKGFWENGKIKGEGKYYWENGNLKIDGILSTSTDNKIILDGICKTYFENGDLCCSGIFDNNKSAGKCKIYKNNSIYYEGDIEMFDNQNAKLHGYGVVYYPNGKNISYMGNFVKGIPSGIGTAYLENGIKVYEGDFINGKSHGRGALYFESGNMKYYGDFYEGKIKGNGKFYNDSKNGDVIKEGRFTDNSNPVSIYL